jgi:hypothetical protein
MKAIVIEPSKPPEARELATYEDMKEAVGGWLELLHISDEVVAYVDEEAKIKANTPPVNRIATNLCYALNIGLRPGDFIRGPMVLVGVLNSKGEYDGEEHDVPESFVKWINDNLSELME